MITGFVTGQSLRLHHGVVASDTIDYLEAEFLFRADDWRDASEIKAVFTRDDGAGEYAIPLTEGKIRKEDHLNLSAGLWKVHLIGCTYSGGDLVQRITTVPDFLRVEKAGAVDGEPLPEVPATDVERLEAEIEEIRQSVGRTDKYVSDYRIETIGFPGRSYIVLIYSDESELKIELPQMGIDIDDVIQFGTSDPTGSTSGATKQLYINTSTGKMWVCKNGMVRPVQWISLSGGEDTGGGITKEELASAVDDALNDAKESGAFDGKDGANGKDGEDGVTPHIGTNGNWFIGSTDTGVRAKGVDGKDGTNGKDGKTPVKGTDYFTDADTAEIVELMKQKLPAETWTFTLEDGSVVEKRVVIL